MTSPRDALRAALDAGTPVPWVMREPPRYIEAESGRTVAEVVGLYDSRHRNAALIVSAVNALPDLLAENAALRRVAKAAMHHRHDGYIDDCAICATLDAARPYLEGDDHE